MQALYDIREYFQGRNDKGRMNSRSSDETYTLLISDLRQKTKFTCRQNNTENLRIRIFETMTKKNNWC
jgi:hypothetical protein